MCCRYCADETPEIREIVKEMNKSPLVEKWQRTTGITTYGEIRPTNVIPVIASKRSGGKAVFPVKWGFSGQTLLMNTHTETASEKATFRDAWASHRCIVPASYYFEWEHIIGNDGKERTGDKYLIQLKGSPMTWLCGLYRIEVGMPVFVILTREPGEGIRFIHDRMPLIMPGDYVNEWIRPDVKPEELLDAAITEMYYERVVAKWDTANDNLQMSML